AFARARSGAADRPPAPDPRLHQGAPPHVRPGAGPVAGRGRGPARARHELPLLDDALVGEPGRAGLPAPAGSPIGGRLRERLAAAVVAEAGALREGGARRPRPRHAARVLSVARRADDRARVEDPGRAGVPGPRRLAAVTSWGGLPDASACRSAGVTRSVAPATVSVRADGSHARLVQE